MVGPIRDGSPELDDLAEHPQSDNERPAREVRPPIQLLKQVLEEFCVPQYVPEQPAGVGDEAPGPGAGTSSSTAGFLRRLVLQLMDAGYRYDDAVHEVAVGTAEGWFGRNDAGQKARPGLAGRMQAALGADWTPEDALLTWTLAQAADGLTPNPTYSNPTFEAAYEGWTPDATLEAAGGQVADISRRNGSAGYLLLVDEAGEGATVRVSASDTDSPVRWEVLRVE